MAMVHQPLPAPSLKHSIMGVGGHTSPAGSPCLGITSCQVKDSRWLTLEVCREFARNKCSRTDEECRFAHPPPNVEIQNGRVMCCFDSIKGRCQRIEPPCKYLHPPQHLKEQLLQNGRNNLLLRNLQIHSLMNPANAAGLPFVPTLYPLPHGYVLQPTAPGSYTQFYPGQPAGLIPGVVTSIDHATVPAVSTNGVASTASPADMHHSEEMTCQLDHVVPQTTSDVTSSYWQSLSNGTVTSSAYIVESNGTTYYTPTSFFHNVSPPNGLIIKGAPPPAPNCSGKPPVPMYATCPPSNPYSLPQTISCYPVAIGATMGPAICPPAPIQQY